MDIVVINDATFGPSRFAKNDDMNIIIKTGATHRRSSNMADDVFSDEPSDAYRKLNTKVENNISDSVPLIRKKRHTGTATINTPNYKIQYVFKYFFDMLVYKVSHNRNEYNTADNQSVVYADKCTNSKKYSVNNHIFVRVRCFWVLCDEF